MSNNKIHDSRCRTIARTPEIIGLDNIVISTGEVYLFGQDRTVGAPDCLAFDPSTKTLYNIEVKCGDGHRDKAFSQLSRNGEFLQRYFHFWSVVDLYVHGDYQVEERRY
jgi:hypothetical protein